MPNPQNSVALVQPMSFPQLPLTPEQEITALRQKHYYDRLLLVQQQSREMAAVGLLGVTNTPAALPPVPPINVPQMTYGNPQQSYPTPIYASPIGTNYSQQTMAQGNIVELPSSQEAPSSSSNVGERTGATGRNWHGGSGQSRAGPLPQQFQDQHQQSSFQAPQRRQSHHNSPATNVRTLPQSVSSQGMSPSQSSFDSGPRHDSVNHRNAPIVFQQQHTSSNTPTNSSTNMTTEHSRAGALPRGALAQVLGVPRSTPSNVAVQPVSTGSSTPLVTPQNHAYEASASTTNNSQAQFEKSQSRTGASSSHPQAVGSQLHPAPAPIVNSSTHHGTKFTERVSASQVPFSSANNGTQTRTGLSTQQPTFSPRQQQPYGTPNAVAPSSSTGAISIASTWNVAPGSASSNTQRYTAGHDIAAPAVAPLDNKVSGRGGNDGPSIGSVAPSEPAPGNSAASARQVENVQQYPASSISYSSPFLTSANTSTFDLVTGIDLSTDVPNQTVSSLTVPLDRQLIRTIPDDTFWRMAHLRPGGYLTEMRCTRADIEANWAMLKAKLANDPARLQIAQNFVNQVLASRFDPKLGLYKIMEGKAAVPWPAQSDATPAVNAANSIPIASSQSQLQSLGRVPGHPAQQLDTSSQAINPLSSSATRFLRQGVEQSRVTVPPPDPPSQPVRIIPSSPQSHGTNPQPTLIQEPQQWRPGATASVSASQWLPRSQPSVAKTPAITASRMISLAPPVAQNNALVPAPVSSSTGLDVQNLINDVLKQLGGGKNKRRRTESNSSGRDETKVKMRTSGPVAPDAVPSAEVPSIQSVTQAPSELVATDVPSTTKPTTPPLKSASPQPSAPDQALPASQSLDAAPPTSPTPPSAIAQAPLTPPSVLPIGDLPPELSSVLPGRRLTPLAVVADTSASRPQEKLSQAPPTPLPTPGHTPPPQSPTMAIEASLSVVSASSPEVESWAHERRPLFLPSTPPSEGALNPSPLKRHMSPAPFIDSIKADGDAEANIYIGSPRSSFRRANQEDGDEIDQLADDDDVMLMEETMASQTEENTDPPTNTAGLTSTKGAVKLTPPAVSRRVYYPDRTMQLTVEIPHRPDLIIAANLARSARRKLPAGSRQNEQVDSEGQSELEAAILGDSSGSARLKSQQSPLVDYTYRQTALSCKWTGCEAQLDSKYRLQTHVKTSHTAASHNGIWLPEALDIGPAPTYDQSLPIPAYEITGPTVKPASLFTARHNAIGPWALQNIFGPPIVVPASPRKRLAQRAKSPKGILSHTMDEYDYLRKVDDEEGRSMGPLQPLEVLVEQAVHIPATRRTGVSSSISQRRSLHSTSHAKSPADTRTDINTGTSETFPTDTSGPATIQEKSTPRYLSLDSADIILSEIRPTKIKPEALASVNLLIDEVLWLILNSARSLATERLSRDGLLRILPTTLGKEALLEAEIELKAYWDRTDPFGRGASVEQAPKSADFPLQAAFELMRLKCEVYSTLGDAEEDIDEEILLQKRMLVASPSPPHINSVPPAALYITAILEHICEHVLANVAKVVARDSSRTSAHLQDLYVALCEDDMMYPLFKRMKVKEDLEAQNKALAMPRRSKSTPHYTLDLLILSDLQLSGIAARSNSSTPQSSRFSESIPGRNSGDSAASHGVASASSPRGSNEKSRLRMFGAGMPSTSNSHQDKPGPGSNLGHRRTGSEKQEDMRAESPGVDHADDDDYPTSVSNHDFDNLMNSDTTMKVSLTPDRLGTLGASVKHKGKSGSPPNMARSLSASSPVSAVRAANSKISPSSYDPSSSAPHSVAHQKPLAHKTSRSGLVPRSAQVKVEAIEEGEDEEGLLASEALRFHGDGKMLNDVSKPRVRTESLAPELQEASLSNGNSPKPDSIKMGKGNNTGGRVRSQTTDSGISPVDPRKISDTSLPPTLSKINTSVQASVDARPGLAKKKSSGLGRSPSSTKKPTSQAPNAAPSIIRSNNGGAAKINGAQAVKRAPARNLEDMDLDSLFADDDEDTAGMTPPGLDPPKTSRLAPPSKNGSPGLGASPVSASTREMMDFLSQGPPSSPPPTSRPNTSSAASISSKKARGRFGRIISKLSRTASTEQMNGSSAEDLNGSRSGTLQVSTRGKLTTSPSTPTYTLPKPPPPPPVVPLLDPPSLPQSTALISPQFGVRLKTISGPPSAAPKRVPPPPRPSTTQTDATRPDDTLPASVIPTPQSISQPVVDSQVSSSVTKVVAAETVFSTAAEEDQRPPGLSHPPGLSRPASPSGELASPPIGADTSSLSSLHSARPLSAPIPIPPVMAEKAVETSRSATPEPLVNYVAPALPSGSAVVTSNQAQQLRALVSRATTAHECRVLVEMLLAQWGLPRASGDDGESAMLSADTRGDLGEELPLVELLLGDSQAVEREVQPQDEDSDTDDTHEIELKTPNPQTEAFLSSSTSPPDVASDLPWVEPAYERKEHPTEVPSMRGIHV
ncbi:hypothetical protein FRB96_000303 [Tulasnella sp. 330]|nr:hypothetical protein FRB96_000303 [Tulasnella sp. 330]KAG8877830.1 hypothetical protein FRB97_003110 [Tulasnella sp. 331]